jgi:hypothetical protein
MMADRDLVSWQRCLCAPLLLAVIAVLAGACASAAPTSRAASNPRRAQEDKSASRLPHLEAAGIGAVQFGTARAKAVAALRGPLGRPNARGINTGCGPRFREVAWHDFIAEFRLGRFTGYRFVTGGWPLRTPHDRVPRKITTPALSTARGITLKSTLKELRAAYPHLRRSGAVKWTARNGLIFVEANDTRNPDSPRARIAEIKIGTCGSY